MKIDQRMVSIKKKEKYKKTSVYKMTSQFHLELKKVSKKYIAEEKM